MCIERLDQTTMGGMEKWSKSINFSSYISLTEKQNLRNTSSITANERIDGMSGDARDKLPSLPRSHAKSKLDMHCGVRPLPRPLGTRRKPVRHHSL
ncbi:hypothetical protein AVEN_41878-1 [Araneus ventricosus]|uniref:Uncharacterized protein n=1 Tax=Araneus ventricosus TaxID=182803 RepID=A0A4Y2AEX7_ARAVE|nr:hypothetical protein AVEN_41878-1 [Araneus ventricosus]